MLQKHENINLRRKKHEYKKNIYNSTKWAIFPFYNQLRRSAVTNSDFTYFYSPSVNLDTKIATGVQLLIKMVGSDRTDHFNKPF